MVKTTIDKNKFASTRIDLVEDYFETHADYWSNAYLMPGNVGDQVLLDRKNIAINFIVSQVSPRAVILDAGCGAGLATLDLLQKNFEVHAYDISKKMLDLCQQNLYRAGVNRSCYSLNCKDVFAANLPAGTFDAILALGFLQYQSDENAALVAMARLLKPGGVLVLSGPVKVKLSEYFGLSILFYGLKNILKKTAPHPELAVLNTISTHYYSPSRFKKLLRTNDFKMLKCRGHGFINFAILRDFTNRGQHFLYRFFKSVAQVLPIGRFGNDMVVLARKTSND